MREEMFVVLDSAVTVTVAGAVNCIDHHGRAGDLPRFPTVLSCQESLQEEDLGGEEGCEGPPRSPVTSSWTDGLVTLQCNDEVRRKVTVRKYTTFQWMSNI